MNTSNTKHKIIKRHNFKAVHTFFFIKYEVVDGDKNQSDSKRIGNNLPSFQLSTSGIYFQSGILDIGSNLF